MLTEKESPTNVQFLALEKEKKNNTISIVPTLKLHNQKSAQYEKITSRKNISCKLVRNKRQNKEKLQVNDIGC